MTTTPPTPRDRSRCPPESRASRTAGGARLLCVDVDPELVDRIRAGDSDGMVSTVTMAPNPAEAATYLAEAPVDCVVAGRTTRIEPLLSLVDSEGKRAPIVGLDVGEEGPDGWEAAVDATCESADELLRVVDETVDDADARSGPSDGDEVEDLRRSNEALSRFAAEVAHDLREPLRTVDSYLSLLERRCGEDLAEDGAEFVAFAVDGARRMRETIDAHLDAARAGAGGASFESVDCDEVLDDVIQDLAVAVAESDATISAGGLPTVVADPTLFRRLLQNLVTNAIEHAGVDSPTVTVDALAREDEWVFEVSDDGLGVSNDRDEDPESFGRDVRTPECGLGLSICEAIVDRHGGRIWIESGRNEGTSVSFTIPRGREGRVRSADGVGGPAWPARPPEPPSETENEDLNSSKGFLK